MATAVLKMSLHPLNTCILRAPFSTQYDNMVGHSPGMSPGVCSPCWDPRLLQSSSLWWAGNGHCDWILHLIQKKWSQRRRSGRWGPQALQTLQEKNAEQNKAIFVKMVLISAIECCCSEKPSNLHHKDYNSSQDGCLYSKGKAATMCWVHLVPEQCTSDSWSRL